MFTIDVPLMQWQYLIRPLFTITHSTRAKSHSGEQDEHLATNIKRYNNTIEQAKSLAISVC